MRRLYDAHPYELRPYASVLVKFQDAELVEGAKENEGLNEMTAKPTREETLLAKSLKKRLAGMITPLWHCSRLWSLYSLLLPRFHPLDAITTKKSTFIKFKRMQRTSAEPVPAPRGFSKEVLQLCESIWGEQREDETAASPRSAAEGGMEAKEQEEDASRQYLISNSAEHEAGMEPADRHDVPPLSPAMRSEWLLYAGGDPGVFGAGMSDHDMQGNKRRRVGGEFMSSSGGSLEEFCRNIMRSFEQATEANQQQNMEIMERVDTLLNE
ncbi:unnamed protein product, partial [Symbiodinium sp. KB8]